MVMCFSFFLQNFLKFMNEHIIHTQTSTNFLKIFTAQLLPQLIIALVIHLFVEVEQIYNLFAILLVKVLWNVFKLFLFQLIHLKQRKT